MGTNTLLLFRHGKSDWESSAATDFDRPLAKRGVRASRRMGRWMAANGWLPDLILSSPARRTRETVESAFAAAGVSPPIEWVDGLYLATPAEMIAVLSEHAASASTVMLVGHNPGMASLTRFLAGEERLRGEPNKLFPTATVARFELPGSWQSAPAGCATAVSIMRPKFVDLRP